MGISYLPGGAKRATRIPILLTALLILAACAGSNQAQQGQPSQGVSSRGPTVLRMAIHEPIEGLYGQSGNVARELGDMFNAGLTYFEPGGTLLPRLAEKIPSTAEGDWRTSPDGTMEVTWKLKPNLKWHDGSPLTAEDLAFSFRVFKDPASRFSVPAAIGFVDEALAPDPQTLVLRYRRVFNSATTASTFDFPPLPRHLLQDTYAQVGAEGLANSPIWTTEWVGLGPYRLTNALVGSHVEGEAFADYVFGRPHIDRLIVRLIPDVNTIVANLLAGELDGMPTGALEAGHGADLKRQWEAAGHGTIGVVQNRLRQMQLQYRDPALPWAGDLRVRQAALHLMDRQAIVDAIIHGLSTPADLAVLPTSRLYPIMEQRGIARYNFDRAQGERLLDAAGWPRGADGVRRNAAGTPLTWNPAVSGEPDLPETLVIVDSFKAAGLVSEPDLISDSLSTNEKNERRGRAHSITRSAGLDYTYWERYLSAEISTAENRWRGSNTGGYTTPAFEALYGQWRGALEPTPRIEREADLHKLLHDELAYLPLFYNVDVFAHRKGLVGPRPNYSEARNVAGEIHTWRYE